MAELAARLAGAATDKRVELIYADRKGAWCMRVMPAVDELIEQRIKTVRREAKLYDAESHRVIGGVEWCDSPGHEGHRRPGHWIWWFETQGPRPFDEKSAQGTGAVGDI